MIIKIEEGDIVKRDENNRVVFIDRPTTLIHIKYREDGSFWMSDHQKKLK